MGSKQMAAQKTKSQLIDELTALRQRVAALEAATQPGNAQALLQERDEHYRRIVETAHEGIWVIGEDLRTTFVNERMTCMLGYTAEEMMGRRVEEFLFDEDLEDYKRKIADRMRGQPGYYERRFRRKDGSAIWTLISATSLDAGKNFRGSFGMFSDITERKLAEQALSESERKFQALAENSLDTIMRFDRQHRHLYVNAVVEQQTGIPAASFIGKTHRELGFPEHLVRLWEAAIQQVFDTGKSHRIEFELPSHLWVDWQLLPELAADGSVNAVITSGRDITERKQQEESLRKYERVVALSPDYISLVDREGRYLLVNDAYLKAGGQRSEEIIGHSISDFTGQAAYENFARPSLLRALDGKTTQFEAWYEFKVLGRRYHSVTYTPYAGADGAITGAVISARDITDLKQAQDELRESEQRYRRLVELSPDAILVHQAGQIVYANATAARLMGAGRADDLLGKLIMDYIHPDFQTVAAERIRLSYEEGRPAESLEEKFTRPDGQVIDVEVASAPIVYRGAPAIHTVFREISQRKQAEEALIESQKLLLNIIDFLPDATLVIDRDGKVIAWNHAIEAMTGVPASEVLGKGNYEHAIPFYGERRPILIDLVLLPREEVEKKYLQLRREGDVLVGETYVPSVRGEGLYLWGTAAVLYNSKGHIVGAIESIRDVNDRHRAEAALQETKEAAEAANKAKSVFLANMSHELRTPLNAILGFSELLTRDPNLAPSQRENLETINRSGEHLLAIINDVLEISKIEAGRITLQEEEFDLYRLMQSLEDTFCLRAHDKGLALTFEQTPDIPRYVRADQGKLRQVLTNLLSNAVKFTPQGHITVRLEGMDFPEGPQASENIPGVCRLRFEVEDTGQGIGPEELGLLFNAFAQTSSGRQSQQGTGLGLAISQAFVRLMGGELCVRSQVGRGSIFWFDVPVQMLSELSAAALEYGRPQRVIGIEPGDHAPDGGPYRLLVVEDVDANRQLLVKLLKSIGSWVSLGDEVPGSPHHSASTGLEEGFEVREAVNGQEAVEIWQQWRPHLIWMDLRMPVMDGTEATHCIKALPDGKNTRIIALTAAAFEDDRLKALSNGFDGFIRKPFREKYIVKALAEHLGVHFVYETAQPTREAETSLAPAAPQSAEQPAWSLAGRKPKWLAEMRQAVTEGDLKWLRLLAQQVQAEDEALANHLSKLVGDLELDEITRLLDQACKREER